ncbi:MAG: hypothetical protein A2381_17775 [Bdellovibrionales bacterium RIFOXYB1_FULL_37_110]|nr:MAG: hypothetical protein A2417_08565 [Bdellovibrionales bacterium RIFOXYC1_FULL_37_79]OFZ59821.1 MAG: hypothetical protein A2381_17775 [Bdellovibrionales bacterium RIFOXYB1_FULL_37_110]OFZ65435.1 MAG: hypothetical protein A2577_18310 [Bdellovibrionales bacterium RIFOXYD1_FULL_36_51]
MAHVIKSLIKSGEYFDSITLMVATKKIKELKRVIDAAIVMGTLENRKILKASGLYVEDFSKALDNDLLISIKGENQKISEEAILKLDEILIDLKKRKNTGNEQIFFSMGQAKSEMKDANVALISIAGKYATTESMKALNSGMNVMLFSDNVSIEDELMLKKYADSKNLLVMGPDCGTSIIGGVPLAFSNKVHSGDIGVVGASGTGTQEVTSLITNLGGGISHAIGTGGRDVGKEIGGITFLSALNLLIEDENTKVILLVSKPPHVDVLAKIGKLTLKTNKQVVAVFLGAKSSLVEKYNMIYAKTLEEGAMKALELSLNRVITLDKDQYDAELKNQVKKLNFKQKYLRGLFSGGTFAFETLLVMGQELIQDIHSNLKAETSKLLDDPSLSIKNTIIDLGADEFTQGRPHPMIDYTLRNERILKEAQDPEVACLYVDLVLGFGSNKNPGQEFLPTIKKAKDANKDLLIICTVTGTDGDPQNKKEIIKKLKEMDVIVPLSNAQGAYLCVRILKKLNRGENE